MSWFENLIPSKIRTSGINDKKNVPEGLWAKCNACDAIIYRAELERNQDVCTKCDHHMRIPARRRLELFLDEEGRLEIATNIESEDILKFRDDKRYRDRLNQAQKATGEKDALIVMQGKVNGIAMVPGFYATIVLTSALIVLLSAGVGKLFPRVNRILIGVSVIALALFGFYQLWLGATSLWS